MLSEVYSWVLSTFHGALWVEGVGVWLGVLGRCLGILAL